MPAARSWCSRSISPLSERWPGRPHDNHVGQGQCGQIRDSPVVLRRGDGCASPGAGDADQIQFLASCLPSRSEQVFVQAEVAKERPSGRLERLSGLRKIIPLNGEIKVCGMSRRHVDIGRHGTGDRDRDLLGLEHPRRVSPPFHRWPLPLHQLTEHAARPKTLTTGRERQHRAPSGDSLRSAWNGCGRCTRHHVRLTVDRVSVKSAVFDGNTEHGRKGGTRIGPKLRAEAPFVEVGIQQ